jgi:hypothetical protein
VLDEPTSLSSGREFFGSWHPPGDRESAESGRLVFDPTDGLTLETTARLPRDAPIVHGTTSTGQLVTLTETLEQTSSFNSRGGHFTRTTARAAFFGIHAATTDELRFVALEARLSNLNDWCNLSGIDVSGTVQLRGGTIALRCPDPIALARPRQALVGVNFEIVGRREPDDQFLPPHRVTLEQEAWLFVRTRTARPLDQLDALMMQVRWFLGFAAGAQDELLELRAKLRSPGPGRHETTVTVVFAPPALLAPERRTASQMLFCLSDLPGDRRRTPLSRWLRLCDRLEMDAVLGPFFAALPSGVMHSDTRFLLFAQSAEAYHARRVPSTRARKVDFVDRIRALARALPAQLARQLPKTFPEEIRDTRNYETHRGAGSRRKAATGERLLALAELLKITLEAAFLRELGFSQREILALLDGNRRIAGTWRWAIGALGRTTPGQ